MAKRTEHGELRHEQGDRPTREAFRDRQNPQEVYLDLGTGNTIYIGANGRTHFLHPKGSIILVSEQRLVIDCATSAKDAGND